MEKVNNVAVLIDAENVPSAAAKQIFDEASNYGNILVKRIFADWSKACVKGKRIAPEVFGNEVRILLFHFRRYLREKRLAAK